MNKNSRVYVAGDRTISSKAIVKRLEELGYTQVLNKIAEAPDLRDPASVNRFFSEWKPEYVFVSSGPAGGIGANIKYPVQFSRDNLIAAAAVLEAAHQNNVKKLLYIGTSCMYPRESPQPMKPEFLFLSPMEATSLPHSSAKLAGMVLCQAYKKQFGDDFHCILPGDIYGPEEHFDSEDSHVVSGIIDKMHTAKNLNKPEAVLWGSGAPVRDFIFSRDFADACIHLMNQENHSEVINISAGKPCSVRELADQIKEMIGFEGKIRFDFAHPDGTPEKRMDVTELFATNWRPFTSMKDALKRTYEAYLESLQEGAAHG